MNDGVQAGAASTHHKHTLVCTGEHTNRIHDCLCSTGAGKSLHYERITGSNLGNDALLFSICIKKVSICCWRTFVLTNNLCFLVLIGESGACGDITGERIKDGVSQLLNVCHHGGGKIREAGRNQTWFNLEVTEVLGKPAQTLNHRQWVEHSVEVRQCNERVRIQGNAQLALQCTS